MSILKVSILLAIILKCVIASESVVAPDVIKVLEGEGFKSIKKNWRKWIGRKDLFDYMATKDPEFISKFINRIRSAKERTLAALFLHRPEMVDDVLRRIGHTDNDLIYLTDHRAELAELHENLFKLIGKIKYWKNQKEAVVWGVKCLIVANKHASIIPLITALEDRSFKRGDLRNVAIRVAFHEETRYGVQGIVEEFHEHPAITSKKYGDGLARAWGYDKSAVFSFLLFRADKCDLMKTQDSWCYESCARFRKIIDHVLETAAPPGTRRSCFFGRVNLAIDTLNDTMKTGVWNHEPGNIIASYLVGEREWRKEMERMKAQGSRRMTMDEPEERPQCQQQMSKKRQFQESERGGQKRSRLQNNK